MPCGCWAIADRRRWLAEPRAPGRPLAGGAAGLCAEAKLTRAEYDKLAVLVGQATQHRLLVGDERTAIREARANMETRITSGGCGDALVVDAIGFFNRFRDRLR